MSKPLQKNEVAKRRFYSYLRESEGFTGESVQAFEKAILLWQDFTNEADFANFNKRTVIDFKHWIKEKRKHGTDRQISLSYCYDVLRRLRKFFTWLSKQIGYKSRINETYIDFLKLSKNDARMAIQGGRKIIPTIEEVKKVLASIKGDSEVDRRDRALISLTLLTGARISALMSLPMRSFDRERLVLDQDPKIGVKTKFRKRIVTGLFPLSCREPLVYYLEWFDYLQKEKGYAPDQPIFPATRREQGVENICFRSSGNVEPVFWKSSGSLRKVFERRFTEAGVSYYHPHTLRHLVVKELTRARLTEEEKKAISQNLGHNDIGTTFGTYGYGKIEEDRQIDLVKSIKLDRTENQRAGGMSEGDMKKIAQMVAGELKNTKN